MTLPETLTTVEREKDLTGSDKKPYKVEKPVQWLTSLLPPKARQGRMCLRAAGKKGSGWTSARLSLNRNGWQGAPGTTATPDPAAY